MLVSAPRSAQAQDASLQGIVTDASSGAVLDLVSVTLDVDGEVQRSTSTDRNGYYQIGGVLPGAYTLRISHLGYLEHEEALVLEEDEQRSVTVALTLDPIVLEGVEVGVEPGGLVQRELGRVRVTPRDLGRIPQPAASGDVVALLQTLPGVVAQGDRGGQLFVRGGTPAENLTLIDGHVIYQPFHIVGFFSAFPEDLVSDADFYVGGFGARYNGRTSSVLDVQMRDGNRSAYDASASVSPFVTEAVVEGPLGDGEASFIGSFRKSLIQHTGRAFAGQEQPLDFESQYLKVSSFLDEASRCSAMGMRTADEGRLDSNDDQSRVSWSNLVVGGRCVILGESPLFRLLEVTFGYSSVDNAAVTRGVSDLRSKIQRMSHAAHTTNLIGSVPIYVGYHAYVEKPTFDFAELFVNLKAEDRSIWGVGGYFEADLATEDGGFNVRPGLVFTGLPRTGLEPRLRASWRPFGPESGELTMAAGLYRQDLAGISDTRDPGSVFVAWMRARDEEPLESVQATLGWQQQVSPGLNASIEGYYKRLRNVPVSEWRAVAQFNTRLNRADGKAYGADVRLELDSGPFYGFIGYGYGQVHYETSEEYFDVWFGEPTLEYSPAHDRRHQVNALASLDIGEFNVGLRWQLGTGFPFTQPLGIDEGFELRFNLEDVREQHGTTRIVLDRPYGGRMPAVHRLDVSVQRSFDVGSGVIETQVGAVNAYDRLNLFYYDLYTGRRVDQLPLVPYVSLRWRPF